VTATDVAMAKELVTKLADRMPFSNEATVHYAHDVEKEVEEVTAPELWIDGTLEHKRSARKYWSKSAVVAVAAIKRQTETGQSSDEATQDEKDDWLTFIDNELIVPIQNIRLGGKLPYSIEFEERLDRDHLRVNAILYTEFQITFPIV
jgi:hypothetical protein